MTPDLWALVGAAILLQLQTLPVIIGRSCLPGGLRWSFGNRETPLHLPAWLGRAQRAHANLVENLPVFAVLVLVAHLAGKANGAAASAAVAFVALRMLYAAVYIAGLIGVRTAVYNLGLAAEVIIAVQLVR